MFKKSIISLSLVTVFLFVAQCDSGDADSKSNDAFVVAALATDDANTKVQSELSDDSSSLERLEKFYREASPELKKEICSDLAERNNLAPVHSETLMTACLADGADAAANFTGLMAGVPTGASSEAAGRAACWCWHRQRQVVVFVGSDFWTLSLACALIDAQRTDLELCRVVF